MTLKQRYDGVIEWFSANMPSAESELHYENPYQLLVAVMLSAQCTDKRVNMTTPALFAAYPTPQALAAATAEDIYPYIRSISYPNNKARSLAAMARMLYTEFGGEVPSDLEALQRLPGVGRKTANVVGAVIWHKEVMPVDTHVFRVSARIGLTRGARTPLQTELQHPAPPAPRGAPLAYPARALRLHGTRTPLRHMRHIGMVPPSRRGREKGHRQEYRQEYPQKPRPGRETKKIRRGRSAETIKTYIFGRTRPARRAEKQPLKTRFQRL